MKTVFATLALTLISTMAFAHPGGHTLTCKSAANAQSPQKVELKLVRSNGVGYFAPKVEFSVDGKAYKISTPSETKNYGDTFHNSPLGVIRVTIDNSVIKSKTFLTSSITAIPSTVKAYDTDGNPVSWSFEAEKDECNDTNGKAMFQGIFNGSVFHDGDWQHLDTQIMDCELVYDSGMAC